MSLRPPSRFATSATAGSGVEADLTGLLDHEIAAEKASALGRAGDRVERSLALLRAAEPGSAGRGALLADAADAVYGYFIQRELCGMRRHHDAIREYAIPREVLARLGAR